MEYETEQRPYDDEPRGYDDRARSRSPGVGNGDSHRNRSASPSNRDRVGSRDPYVSAAPEEEPEARNTGSNLFVTGIHPKLSESEVAALFEKYGDVEKCNIMRDPHSKESRGFGFVNMSTGEGADAAKDGLQGQFHEGRTLSIEKARRSKPRTPTPGKYFGPPKLDYRGPPPPRGRFGDRYDDRRGGGYGGRRDDSYRSSRYGGSSGGRYEDRGYSRRYEDRPPIDRYASNERYGGSRGGGGRDYYDREPRDSRESRDSRGGSGRQYESGPTADDGYSRH